MLLVLLTLLRFNAAFICLLRADKFPWWISLHLDLESRESSHYSRYFLLYIHLENAFLSQTVRIWLIYFVNAYHHVFVKLANAKHVLLFSESKGGHISCRLWSVAILSCVCVCIFVCIVRVLFMSVSVHGYLSYLAAEQSRTVSLPTIVDNRTSTRETLFFLITTQTTLKILVSLNNVKCFYLFIEPLKIAGLNPG